MTKTRAQQTWEHFNKSKESDMTKTGSTDLDTICANCGKPESEHARVKDACPNPRATEIGQPLFLTFSKFKARTGSTAEHSPTPWNVYPADKGVNDYEIWDKDDNFLDKYPSSEERYANAAFICRAVNSYSAMREALQPVAEIIAEGRDTWDNQYFGDKSKLGIYLTKAQMSAIEAALKLAER